MNSRKKITIALVIAIFIEAIEGTVVSTAIPKLAADLGGVQYISWIFATYFLISAISIPIYGSLSDIYGRRKILNFGVIVFLIGSISAGLSQSMWQLIASRALQGLGAGAIRPTTFTIVGDIYPAEERAPILGLFGTVWGVAGVGGPLLGGLLTDYYSWRLIFFINVPFCLLTLLLICLFFKEKVAKKEDTSLDIWGAFTFTIAVSCFLYAVTIVGEDHNWGSLWTLSLFTIAFTFLLLFLRIESKVKNPMLPLHLFKNRTIVVCCIAGFLGGAVIICPDVYLPLWIQGIFGQGATVSALALIPVVAGWPVGSFIGGYFLKKVGPQSTALMGAILLLLGNTCMFFITQLTPYWVLFVIMLVVGVGIGLLMVVLLTVIQSSVGHALRGITTASYVFLRSLGFTVGVALYGAVFNNFISRYMITNETGISINSKNLNQLLQNNDLQTTTMQSIRSALEYGIHYVFGLTVLLSVLVLVAAIRLPRENVVEE